MAPSEALDRFVPRFLTSVWDLRKISFRRFRQGLALESPAKNVSPSDDMKDEFPNAVRPRYRFSQSLFGGYIGKQFAQGRSVPCFTFLNPPQLFYFVRSF